MRLIDADALSAFVGDLRSTLHKEQSTFKAMTEIEFNTRDYMLLNFQQTIDNAPTVEAYTEDDVKTAIKEGHEVGYSMAKAKFERPQGEWRVVKNNELIPLYCICTNCREMGINKFNFCPNCGADMRGEHNEQQE